MKVIITAPLYKLHDGANFIANVLHHAPFALVMAHINIVSDKKMNKNSILAEVRSRCRCHDEALGRFAVNPVRLTMKSPHYASPSSLVDIFFSNVRAAYFKWKTVNWTHVVHMTQNERLVRFGMEEYVSGSGWDAGFTKIEHQPDCGKTVPQKKACKFRGHSISQLERYWPRWRPVDRWRWGLFDGGFLSRSVVLKAAFEETTWNITTASERVRGPQEILLPSLITKSHRTAPSSITLFVKPTVSCQNITSVKNGNLSFFFAIKRSHRNLCRCVSDCKNIFF